MLAFEGVQDDSFQQVAESHFLQLGDGFEHFQQALFHPDAGLDALNDDWFTILLFLRHVFLLGTLIPMYQDNRDLSTPD